MTNDIEHKIAPNALERQRTAYTLSLKSLDETGVFAGYASVFNVIDSQHDVILPGAFRETLMQRKSDIKLLWQHDMREPIGVVEEVREDASGLYVKGRLLLDIARAREAYLLLRQGVVSGLSIGYTPRNWKTDGQKGVRRLLAVDLWEISLVTFPANDAARVTVVKQGKTQPKSEEKQWNQAISRGEVMRLAATLEQARNRLENLCMSRRQ